MKVIIAGSRTITNYKTVEWAINRANFDITEVVSGTAHGVDQLGERYADENKLSIKRFPADWSKYGKAAGYIRNKQMAEYADALIAVWDTKSRGTWHMIETAQKLGLRVYVERVSGLWVVDTSPFLV